MRKSSADPCLFVIIGARGDLTRRKLLPALYQLMDDARLPERCHILGVGRDREADRRSLPRAGVRGAGEGRGSTSAQKTRRWCDARIDYQGIGKGAAADYERLAVRIAEIERRRGLRRQPRLLSRAAAGGVSGTIEALGKAGLNRSKGWTRLVIEKPFGHDLAVGAGAERARAPVFRRERRSTASTTTWARRRCRTCWCSASPTRCSSRCGIATTSRACRSPWPRSWASSSARRYYEQAGALRDMVQNHLTQLLDADRDGGAGRVRRRQHPLREGEGAALDRADHADDASCAASTRAGDDRAASRVPGYREEPGVAPRSRTETFAALELEIDNWRWQGVPFYLRTGKRLPDARHARSRSSSASRRWRCSARSTAARRITNVLLITMQPDEGFALYFRRQGAGRALHAADASAWTSAIRRRSASSPEAYQTLLLDVVEGDQTLFVHADEAEAAWRLYAPLLKKRWPLRSYPAGGPGPAGAPLTAPADTQRVCWHAMPDRPALDRAAAELILKAAASAIRARGQFHLVLAGGDTPRGAYRKLRESPADWSAWHIYFGDERCVPRDDPARNSRMAAEAWLDHVARSRAPDPSDSGGARRRAGGPGVCRHSAARRRIRSGGARARRGRPHREPVSRARLGRSARLAGALAVLDAPKPPRERVSLSAARLSYAREAIFLVSGESKRQAMADWRAGKPIPARAVVPTAGVAPTAGVVDVLVAA